MSVGGVVAVNVGVAVASRVSVAVGVAWAGALTLQPGIIVIAGTGCIVFGVTETGREVRNYSFEH